MIDFKKEVLKFQPAKTVEDVQDGLVLNEIKDLNELLQQLVSGKTEPSPAPRRAEHRERYRE
ncbi:MAG: hypothetical protein LBS19_14520 [Clostridiales bacterium]|jgi:hypothetical protein|nr:hypothetical protein [Clostridiales bacterium]